jgi:hypothetical protein
MKRDNPLADGGALLFLVGALAFFPPLLDRELLILAWLGGMAQPVGLSAMVVGGILFGLGKLQQFRNSSPVASPTDFEPAAAAGPAVPAETVAAAEAVAPAVPVAPQATATGSSPDADEPGRPANPPT